SPRLRSSRATASASRAKPGSGRNRRAGGSGVAAAGGRGPSPGEGSPPASYAGAASTTARSGRSRGRGRGTRSQPPERERGGEGRDGVVFDEVGAVGGADGPERHQRQRPLGGDQQLPDRPVRPPGQSPGQRFPDVPAQGPLGRRVHPAVLDLGPPGGDGLVH